MDTSLEYLELCQKAKEIQELRNTSNYKEGDYVKGYNYLWNYSEGIKMIHSCDDDFYEVSPTETSIWLPRQDQIQDLYIEFKVRNSKDSEKFKEEVAINIAKGIMIYQFRFFLNEYGNVSSFEILWLRFYMRFVHNKIWDNNYWSSL